MSRRKFISRWRWFVLLLVVFGIGMATVSHAQQAVYDVFFDPDEQTLYFVDASTGLSSVSQAEGSQHTLLSNGVIYQEASTGFARLVAPRTSTVLTWMQPATDNISVQWIASADGRYLVWTVVQGSGTNLSSDLHVAQANGDDAKVVKRIASAEGKAAYPLMITNDGQTLFYTLQAPPNPTSYIVFPVAADIHRLDLNSDEDERLPNEPSCACPAGFSANGQYYARFEPNTGNSGGFAVRLWSLPNEADSVTPVIPNFVHTQAGNVLITNDGNRLVYASARGISAGRSERYTVILVDRQRNTQTLLTDALTDGLRPVSFTPDGNSVILVGLTKGGTYKLNLTTQAMLQVSAYNFMGQLHN
jgi:hypothetical protein